MRLPNGSGVKREFHAPFCERLVGQFRWSTLPLLTSELITLFFNQQVTSIVECLTRIQDPNGKKTPASDTLIKSFVSKVTDWVDTQITKFVNGLIDIKKKIEDWWKTTKESINTFISDIRKSFS